jgi:hypothetical protein
LILIFGIIKILSILGDEATIWAWIGLILCVVIAVGAWRTVQEAGGVDTLRSEAQSLSASASGGGSGDAPAATAPPAAPPPPAPEPDVTPDDTPEPEKT